jgi:hypothetical protein
MKHGELKMSLTTRKLALGLLFSLTAINANATLTSYTGAGGAGLVYSSVSNVTWTQNANLLGTMLSTLGNENVVNAIIAASPIIYDTPNYYDGLYSFNFSDGTYSSPGAFSGQYSVTANDFYNADGQTTWFGAGGGQTTWFGAKAFANYLNSINYGGSTQWRLPTSNAIYGYNGTAGNEMGQLFYSELGGIPGNRIPDTSIFTSEYDDAGYWLGTELVPNYPYTATDGYDYAWLFTNSSGLQYNFSKFSPHSAWAVSPGQVAAVSVPGAVWLMASGLLGLLASKRRGHDG